ncbi:hypothetical protein, partial [Amedibacillus hominis]|nr:LytR family transcriptional regulator [Amedibacillus hominis]
MENIKKIGKHIFWIIQLIVSLVLTYSVYKLLPLKYLAIVILILAVLLGLVIFMQLSSKTNKAVKMGSKVLAIVLSVLMVFVNVKVINKAQ